VNDTWNNLLTHATLALDKDGKIRGCHLNGYIQSTVQGIAVAHDVIPALYVLKFNGLHNFFQFKLKMKSEK
jgi:hypothetical protein